MDFSQPPALLACPNEPIWVPWSLAQDPACSWFSSSGWGMGQCSQGWLTRQKGKQVWAVGDSFTESLERIWMCTFPLTTKFSPSAPPEGKWEMGLEERVGTHLHPGSWKTVCLGSQKKHISRRKSVPLTMLLWAESHKTKRSLKKKKGKSVSDRWHSTCKEEDKGAWCEIQVNKEKK